LSVDSIWRHREPQLEFPAQRKSARDPWIPGAVRQSLHLRSGGRRPDRLPL